MEIQFQHANPHSGRESVVLRIDGLLADQTVCVLVDAGQDVSTDDLEHGQRLRVVLPSRRGSDVSDDHADQDS